jgi:hypothetical protein
VEDPPTPGDAGLGIRARPAELASMHRSTIGFSAVGAALTGKA